MSTGRRGVWVWLSSSALACNAISGSSDLVASPEVCVESSGPSCPDSDGGADSSPVPYDAGSSVDDAGPDSKDDGAAVDASEAGPATVHPRAAYAINFQDPAGEPKADPLVVDG